MKYTRKMQQGGGLVMYQPTPIASQTSTTAPSGAVSTSTKSSILDDDIKKELLSGGLTNETNALVAQLMEIENQSSNPFLQSENRRNSLALIAQINELKQNKAMWKQSYDIAKESGGLGEIAVGDNGELYVKDTEGSLKTVSIADYKKNSDKLRALSVAELLEERNSNPNLIGYNNIFNVANNSIGIENISAYAQKIVNALGREEIKNQEIYDRDELSHNLDAIKTDLQKSGRNPTTEELRGFRILDTIKNSPSRYNEIITSSSTEKNHALKAVKYIWTTLGTNAQKKLAAQAAVNGVSPSDMLLDLIVIGADESSSTQVNPVSESKATSGSDSMTGAENLTSTEMLFRGTLGTGKRFVFNDPEYSTKFEGLMTGIMPLTTAKGNQPIGPTTLTGVLKQGEWERLVDTNNIYFGNKKVEDYQKNDIIFDGNADIARVYLPVKGDGSPDTESMQDFKEAMNEYDKNKDNMSPTDITRLFLNHGFSVKVNPDKTIEATAVGTDVKPFLVTYGFTNDASSLIDDNILNDERPAGLRQLDKNESEGVKVIENIAYTIGRGKDALNLKPTEGFIERLFTGTRRYKGIVFMPERPNASVEASAMVGAGPRAVPNSEEDVRRILNTTSGNIYVPTNTSALNE